MIANRLLLLVAMGLAGCGQAEVNPPTKPASPINTPEAQAPPPTPPPGVGTVLPGSGPQTFVGRWSAQTAWCANTQGAERPIEITTTRFAGYENSCDILSIRQVADGYEAALVCAAAGRTASERIRMAVHGDVMRLTWMNRSNAVVRLTRCAAPEAAPVPTPMPAP